MGKRRSGDRGASLVELALVLPLLVMLLVGMVSAGIAYNNQLALTHAAREGGRYAATLPVTNFGDVDDWLREVVRQTIEDGTGALDDGVDGRTICAAYVFDPDNAPSETRSLEIDESGTESFADGPCFPDGRTGDEHRVQVAVARNIDFNVVFFSSDLTLDAEAVNRYEAHQ